MPNMSYCRFHNTEQDLKDCYNNMEETADMSEPEIQARRRLIYLCVRIALDYGIDVDRRVEVA